MAIWRLSEVPSTHNTYRVGGIMKKLLLLLAAVLAVALCMTGCGKESFDQQKVVWYSENPELVFSTTAFRPEQVIVVGGETFDIDVEVTNGKNLKIYDMSSYPLEKNLIWECKTKWKKKDNIVEAEVIKDNVGDNVGLKFTLKSRDFKSTEEMPADKSEQYHYKYCSDKLKNLGVESHICEVFKNQKKCVVGNKEIRLDEIKGIGWYRYTTADINNDGTDELMFSVMDAEGKAHVMVFRYYSGKVYLYSVYAQDSFTTVRIREGGLVEGYNDKERQLCKLEIGSDGIRYTVLASLKNGSYAVENSASDKDKFEEYINQFKELTMYDN